jgi:hypothetical protein
MDDDNLGLGEVMDAVMEKTIGSDLKDDYEAEIQRNINFRVLFHMMNLAAHKEVHPQVNAITNAKLRGLKARLSSDSGPYAQEMLLRINDFYEHPEQFEVIPAPKIPDGSPIGMDCFH